MKTISSRQQVWSPARVSGTSFNFLLNGIHVLLLLFSKKEQLAASG